MEHFWLVTILVNQVESVRKMTCFLFFQIWTDHIDPV